MQENETTLFKESQIEEGLENVSTYWDPNTYKRLFLQGDLVYTCNDHLEVQH